MNWPGWKGIEQLHVVSSLLIKHAKGFPRYNSSNYLSIYL